MLRFQVVSREVAEDHEVTDAERIIALPLPRLKEFDSRSGGHRVEYASEGGDHFFFFFGSHLIRS